MYQLVEHFGHTPIPMISRHLGPEEPHFGTQKLPKIQSASNKNLETCPNHKKPEVGYISARQTFWTHACIMTTDNS